jgi:hypothetical protein
MRRVLPEWSLRSCRWIIRCIAVCFGSRSKGQVPNGGLGMESQWNGGVTWERPDAREVHHRAIFDDRAGCW